MRAAVHLPLRIVVDPRSAEADLEEVAARAEAALRRALDRSAEAVREVRHGRRLRLTAPRFTWSGAAAGGLDGAARERIVAALDAAVAGAVARSALADGREVPGRDRPDLSARASEAARAARHDRRNGLYYMPSYQGDGAEVPVPVVESEGDGAAQADGEPEDGLEEDPLDAVVFRKFLHLNLEQLVAAVRAFRADPRYASFFEVPMWGVAYEDEQGRPSIVVFESGDEADTQVIAFRIGRLLEAQLDRSGRTPRTVLRPVGVSAVEDLTVRYFASGTAEDVLPRLRERYVRLFSDLRRDVLGVAALNFTADEIEAQAADDVDAALEDFLRGSGQSQVHFVELTMGARSFLVQIDIAPSQDLGAHLFPLTEVDLDRVPGGSTSGREGATGGGGRRRGRGRGRGRGGGRRRGRDADGGGGDGGGGPGGGDGDGTRPGEEGGGGEGAPGFVVAPEALLGEGGTSFPLAGAGASAIVLGCDAFEGEASLEALGADGERLRGQMRQIAYLLQIPVCDYPARFCINAMMAIEARAWGVSAASKPEADLGFTAPVPSGGRGNLGLVEFTPIPSPAIQFLRQFARTVPMISAMTHDLDALYIHGGRDDLIQGRHAGRGTAWALRFAIALTDASKHSLGIHFMVSCQVLLLQLLRRSRREIDRRLENFDVYGPLFLSVLGTQLTDVAVYERLRERLENAPPPTGALPGTVVDWSGAARAWTATLETRGAAPPAVREGQIVDAAGTRMITDADGRLWSKEMLDRAILLRRGNAEDIDPLIKQLTEVPEIVERLKGDPQAVLEEIRALLREMQDNNAEMQGKAGRDLRFAFRASPIHESLEGATVAGTSLALQGVHLLAHQRVGGFFGGSALYPDALNRLFGAELGLAALTEFFKTLSVITLSIVCPPAGAALDRVFAAVELADAEESERLFESLIDPELVISRGQVEAQLFAARLGAVFAFVPGAGRILRLGRQAVRVGSRGGARLALASVRRGVARQITRDTAAALARSLPRAFVEEVVVDQAMDAIVGKLLEGIVADIQREARITGSVGGSAGAAESLRALGLDRTDGASGGGVR